MSAYRNNHAISLVPADQISSMCITAGLNKTTGLTTETTGLTTETTGLTTETTGLTTETTGLTTETTGLTTETNQVTEITGLNETTAVTRPTAKPPS